MPVLKQGDCHKLPCSANTNFTKLSHTSGTGTYFTSRILNPGIGTDTQYWYQYRTISQRSYIFLQRLVFTAEGRSLPHWRLFFPLIKVQHAQRTFWFYHRWPNGDLWEQHVKALGWLVLNSSRGSGSVSGEEDWTWTESEMFPWRTDADLIRRRGVMLSAWATATRHTAPTV